MGFKENFLQRFKEVTKAFSAEDALGSVKNAGDNIFGFYSTSGGNGTTTLVVNIADALRYAKKRVAVIDFDLLHPQCFRYLLFNQEEPPLSMIDRWINTNTNISEFAGMSEDNFIAVFSARLENDVYELSELSIDAIKQFILDISKIYDFVLIDIHGDLNQECTVACAETCTEIFTLIRPTLGDLENAYKDNLCAINFSLGYCFTNLIQSPVHQLTISDAEIKEFDDISFKNIVNLPYVSAIPRVGQNYELFLLNSNGTDDASVAYRQAVKFLAELILNYHSGKTSAIQELNVNSDQDNREE